MGDLISRSRPRRSIANRPARHAMRAMRVENQKPVDVHAKSVKQYVPQVQFDIGIGGPIHFRAVAKSCFNLLGLHAEPPIVLPANFDGLRDYVLYGVDHFDDLNDGAGDPFPAIASLNSPAGAFWAIARK